MESEQRAQRRDGTARTAEAERENMVAGESGHDRSEQRSCNWVPPVIGTTGFSVRLKSLQFRFYSSDSCYQNYIYLNSIMKENERERA